MAPRTVSEPVLARHRFVVPTYSLHQVDNVQRLAATAAVVGLDPVIVANSAASAAALARNPATISLGYNTGFGGAAAQVALGEFETIVLCNDDLVIGEPAMRALRIALDEAPKTSIIGFLPAADPRVLPQPGVGGVLALVSGFSVVTRRIAARGVRRHHGLGLGLAPSTARPLPVGLGFPFVCVAVTRRAWEILGGFDARFPLYFEDADLLARAQLHPTVEVSVALLDVVHAQSATSRTQLSHILPLMATGARNHLQIHCGMRRTTAAAIVTAGLVARSLGWVPLRADRAMEWRAVRRAIAATWSSEPPPLPPWE